MMSMYLLSDSSQTQMARYIHEILKYAIILGQNKSVVVLIIKKRHLFFISCSTHKKPFVVEIKVLILISKPQMMRVL